MQVYGAFINASVSAKHLLCAIRSIWFIDNFNFLIFFVPILVFGEPEISFYQLLPNQLIHPITYLLTVCNMRFILMRFSFDFLLKGSIRITSAGASDVRACAEDLSSLSCQRNSAGSWIWRNKSHTKRHYSISKLIPVLTSTCISCRYSQHRLIQPTRLIRPFLWTDSVDSLC